MLQSITANQMLAQHDYEVLDQLVPNRDFPLIVRHQSQVFVAKLIQAPELAVVQHMQHHPIPGMPKVIEWFQDADVIVMIEEFINGQTLAAVLKAQGQFNGLAVKTVALAILHTLVILHQQAIVHRDIKLSNIMVSNDHYYLIDISAAREYKPNQSQDTRLLGTSGFAAPENYGFAQTDARSDLFSLGVVLNCLLTGYVPTESQMVRRHLTTNVVWRPIVQRAIEIDARQRYQTANAMLQAVLATQPAPNLKPVPPRSSRTGWFTNISQPTINRWLKRIGWGIYIFFSVGLTIAAVTDGTRADRLWSLIFVIGLLGLPMFLHWLNLQAYHWMPKLSTTHWRFWLIAAEVMLFLYLNGNVETFASIWHAHVFP